MGLRFRKSVTLCKGVKLNFGKTGVSVTIGQKGCHKTIHQNGNVTTSMGIPGTGIYWTDTKNIYKEDSTTFFRKDTDVEANTIRYIEQQSVINENLIDDNNIGLVRHESKCENNSNIEKRIDYLTSSKADTYSSQDIELKSQVKQSFNEDSKNIVNVLLKEEDIYLIYRFTDELIDWTEILVSSSESEVFMDRISWKYYKSIAEKILKGDIDTYLKVIEDVKPLDDLLSFGGNFEFGTDNAGIMEIEFDVKPQDILGQKYTTELFCDYVCAVSIRSARDIFSLLPVKFVVVHAVLDNQTVLSVLFNRDEMNKINFMEKPQAIVNQFKHNMNKCEKMLPVDRILFSMA